MDLYNMTSLKPTLSLGKLKGSVLSIVHFESIVSDVIVFIQSHFPSYATLKDDLHFIECILQIIIGTIEQNQSPALEKQILCEVFKRLFSTGEAEKLQLEKTVDYLILNQNVVKRGVFGKLFLELKKEVSKVSSLFVSTSKTS